MGQFLPRKPSKNKAILKRMVSRRSSIEECPDVLRFFKFAADLPLNAARVLECAIRMMLEQATAPPTVNELARELEIDDKVVLDALDNLHQVGLVDWPRNALRSLRVNVDQLRITAERRRS